MNVDTILSTCQTCGGRIVAQTDAIQTHHTGAWLHLHDSDWSENYGASPHHAIPDDRGLAELARAVQEEAR